MVGASSYSLKTSIQVNRILLHGKGQSMIYQKLNSTDVPQLFHLMQQYKKSIGEPDLSPEQTAKLKSAIAQSKIQFYVVKHNDELIAMCSVSIVFSTYLCAKNGIFEDFFVSENYRHKGVARGLTSYVFEDMRVNDVVSVWIGCADIDVEMYKSLGFRIPLGNLLTWSSQE